MLPSLDKVRNNNIGSYPPNPPYGSNYQNPQASYSDPNQNNSYPAYLYSQQNNIQPPQNHPIQNNMKSNYDAQEESAIQAMMKSNSETENTKRVKINGKIDDDDLSEESIKKHIATVYTTNMMDDYKNIENFNLIDDESLDQLYEYFPVHNNQFFLFHIFSQMYIGKYEKLLEEYESLNYFIFYIIGIIVFQDEKTLINKCKTMNDFKKPEFKSMRFGKKRKLEENIPEKLECSQHLFFKTEDTKNFYKRYHLLFHLGEATKYLCPSEFAPLFMKIKNDDVKIYTGKKGEHQSKNGLRVSFTKKIIFPLTTTFVEHNYHNALYTRYLTAVLELVTKKKFDNLPINMGKGEHQKIYNIQNLRVSSLKEDNSVFDTKTNLHVTLLNELIGSFSNKDQISFKTYSDVDHIPDICFKFDEEYLEKYNSEFEIRKKELEKEQELCKTQNNEIEKSKIEE